MEEMGCGFKWLFTDHDLRNTPSYKAHISPSQEQTFRTKMALLIQTIGSKSRLTQLAMNTSIIFMHRFFMYRTVRQYPRLHLAVAFAFAGGKVEESFCKLEHLVRSAVDVIRSNKNREFLDKTDGLTYEMDCQWRNKMEAILQSNCNTESSAYQDMRKIILECEAEIYAVIGFNLSIIHPHNFVVKMCSLLGSENTKEISHYAYNLATAGSQLTMLCLKYKPEFIAVMCLSIAAKAHNVEFKGLINEKQWYQAFDETVLLSDVEAVSREFLNLAKGYPYWKDANGQQVFLNRRNVLGQPRAPGSSTPQSARQQSPHVPHATPQSHSSSQPNMASPSYVCPPRPPSNVTPTMNLTPMMSLQAQAQQGYAQGGGSVQGRQNPGDVGNGRNGVAAATSVTPSRDPASLLSRNHQRSLPQQHPSSQQQHSTPQQQQQQQNLSHHHHHHHHAQQHHQNHPHQYQQRPGAPATVSSSHVTPPSHSSLSTLSASQLESAGSARRPLSSVPAISQSLTPQPSSLHHSTSSPALSQLTQSSSGRNYHIPQPSNPLDMSGQQLPRSASEQSRGRQIPQPNPQELSRSQSLQRPRPEANVRPTEPINLMEDRRSRAIRSATASHPSLQHQELQHAQSTQPAVTADLSHSHHHHQQLQHQQQAAVSRQSQVNAQQHSRQQSTTLSQQHQQQQQPQQVPRQPLNTAGQQHHQQAQRQQSLSQRQHLLRQVPQLPQRTLTPKEAGELSPHTPHYPYPGELVNPPLAPRTNSVPPSATAAYTLPGSGDAPQVAAPSLSRHTHRNGQRQNSKAATSHGMESSSSKAAITAFAPAPIPTPTPTPENSRSNAQTRPLPTVNQPEPSTSGPLLNDRVLKIKLEPCSSSPVQSVARVKSEPLANSPGEERVLLSGASSSFTKPQDSPSNPRIKIKVKRESTAAAATNERHSVKYADSGLKIKIKPPKPEGEVEPGPSVSGHSSRSSTPREEGEVEGTPSPASSTSSGRKSEGLKLRLSVPKGEGSKRDGDQWTNGVVSERESSSSCHRSHHHNHHHSRHHKSKKHSKHSRHEGKSSNKRSAQGDTGEERPSKSSRSESSNGGGTSSSFSLQTGGYPGLASTSLSSSSGSFSGFNSSDSLHHGGFSITDAFSTTMPNDIFDDDDEDTLPSTSIPLTPVDAVPQVTSHHERFQQMMNQNSAQGASSSSRNTTSKL